MLDSSFYEENVGLEVYLGKNRCYIPNIIVHSGDIDCIDYIKKDRPGPVYLDEVKVYAGMKIIEEEVGKLVYNVEKDSKNISSISAKDVFQRAPMLTTDYSGTPSLRGDSNVTILLNGKPIRGLSNSEIINQIPANEISKLEIITSPSSKYDSSGTGGIVNIITKKRIALNGGGSLLSGLGGAGSHLYTNYSNKIGSGSSFSSSLGGMLSYPRFSSSQNFSSPSGRTTYSSEGNDFMGSLHSMSSIDKSYKKSSLNTSFIFFYSGVSSNEKYKFSFEDLETKSSFRWAYNYFEVNLNQEFGISNNNKFSYSVGGSYIPVSNSNEIPLLQNKSEVEIYNAFAKIDYEVKTHKRLKINFGTNIDASKYFGSSRTEYGSLNQSIFNGYQYVLALYIDIEYKLSNALSLYGGSRPEHYSFSFKDFSYDFKMPFYTFGSSYKLNYKHTLSLNYSKRKQQPLPYNLFPLQINSNSNIYHTGNPRLRVGISHNFELSLSSFISSNYLKGTIFYKKFESRISRFLEITNNVVTFSNVNYDNEDNYGFSFWSKTSFFRRKVDLNGGLDIIYKAIDYLSLNKEGWQFSGNINLTVDMGKNWYVNLFGNFGSNNIFLQGEESLYTFRNISIRKKMLNNKLSMAFSVDNPFVDGFTQTRTYEFENQSLSSSDKFYNRSFRFVIDYRFGKNENKILLQEDKLKNIKNGF